MLSNAFMNYDADLEEDDDAMYDDDYDGSN
jgi:hypothetical protein